MVKRIKFIILFALLVHGYFYLRYQTPYPCEAAMMRVMQDEPDKATTFNPQAILESKSDTTLTTLERKSDTILQCYALALIGPKALGRMTQQRDQQSQK